MIASNICHLTLISISWMSAVSAVPIVPELTDIESFLQYAGNDLAAAYDALPEQILDTYFVQFLECFELALKPYLNDLSDPVRNGDIDPPKPDEYLTGALHELSRFVDLIIYSNVSILNRLKKFWEVPAPSLTIINDEYLNDLSKQYRINSPKHGGHFFQPYILKLARLYAMNNAMFFPTRSHHELYDHLPGYQYLINRFHIYEVMIIRLQNDMAQYMQIQTLRPYAVTFTNLNTKLNDLRHPPYGLQNIPELQTVVTHLYKAVLSMILIYGTPARPGMQIVSDLLANRWEIRRILGLELDESATERVWYLILLRTLEGEVEKIRKYFGRFHLWIWTIQPILEKAITLVDDANFQVEQEPITW